MSNHWTPALGGEHGFRLVGTANATPRYYNGTAKFTLEPWDEGEDGEEVCSRYRKSTITFTFKTLVAVVERNEDDEGENPFMFLVRSWPDGVDDLWPTGGNTNPSPEQINSDIYALDSVTCVSLRPRHHH